MVDRPVAVAGTEAGSVEVVGVVVGVAMAATRAEEELLEIRAAREEVTAAGSEAVSEAGLEAWPEERSAGVGTAAAAAARRAAVARRAAEAGGPMPVPKEAAVAVCRAVDTAMAVETAAKATWAAARVALADGRIPAQHAACTCPSRRMPAQRLTRATRSLWRRGRSRRARRCMRRSRPPTRCPAPMSTRTACTTSGADAVEGSR
jgi:hypothetical protein